MWGALGGWGGWAAAGALALLSALSAALAACVCGCRDHHQKNELVGTAGVLKIRFDEEVPSPTPTTPASVKRASTQNSQRSLPEIPHPVGRHDSGDTASEIYATVNLDEGATKEDPAPSTSRDHSYEHAYAKLQNESHVHIEISPEKQPFTSSNGDEQTGARDTPSQAALESVVISASVAISGQLPSSQELPYITPPSPLPHPEQNPQHFSGDSTDSAKGYTSISVREPLSNIRAILQNKSQPQQHYATVSDDSDEMYAAIDDPNGSGGGGSDTYAQIAPQETRQPPPELRQQPPELRQPSAERNSQERERASLLPSDAGSRRSAPPESSSEAAPNHSRQASASSCSNSVGNLGSPKPEKRQANSPLPPPPPLPASSAHTLASLDGTKPERKKQESPHNHTNISSRQQRISSTGDLHFIHDKHRRSLNEKHQRNNSCVSSSDFYGCNYPVEKHRFSSGDLIRPLVAKELNFDIDKPVEQRDNVYNSIEGPRSSEYSSAEANIILAPERAGESPARNVEEMYAKVMKKAKSKLHPEEVKSSRKLTHGGDSTNHNVSHEHETSNTSKFSTDDPGYETIHRKRSVNHGYETITEKVRKISQNQDPGYETVRDMEMLSLNVNCSNNNLMNKPDHVADSGPNSILSSDPGYEHISKMDNFTSDSDPNYEVLRNQPPTPPYATIAPNYNMQPTYSVINKNPAKHNWTANNNEDNITEPNYESMPHDPIYTTGSESDPNYESVRPKDSNYESVRPKDPNYETVNAKDPNYESVRSKDPNYESVRSKSKDRFSSKDPNYESVKLEDPNYESVKYKEPPYERVQNDTEVERSDSAAGYEKIKAVTNKSSINGEGSVSDYFQV